MSEERLSEALAAMEAGLASLQPKPSSLHRARVIYLAGQASVGGAKGASSDSRAGRAFMGFLRVARLEPLPRVAIDKEGAVVYL